MNSMDLFRLDRKVAIVTGGTSRFGEPISRILAEAGAHVVIASRNLDACRALADDIKSCGLLATGMQMDLADDESIQRLVKETANIRGTVDILVCNAVSRDNAAELEELSRDMIMNSLDMNLAGQISLIKNVLPYMMRQNEGSIILLSSTSALAAPKFSLMTETRKSPLNYAVEKWGINGLTRWLAAKYGKNNIRVNCLCPGTYDPEIFNNPQCEAYINNFIAYNPIPRFMQAHEIMGPALFLASRASSFCTGVILPVDGGYTI